jgi:sortase A
MENDQPKSGNSPAKPHDKSQQAAVELIRKKVEAAYSNEPSVQAEIKQVKSEPKNVQLSNHQRFIKSLMESNQSLSDIHQAWHDYYADLSDAEKHEVWREFYAAHGHADHYEHYVKNAGKPKQRKPTHETVLTKAARHHTVTKLRRQIDSRKPPAGWSAKRGSRSLIIGVGAGLIAVMIVMFGFFNERFIAPFIQPSRALTNAPLISDSTTVGPNPELVIPKINLEIPVVYDVNTIDEQVIEKGLERGVVHYADTPLPGQNGNSVIVGHSSNNIFNPGQYKFAFVLLNRLDTGDTFYLQKDGKRYTYQVYKKAVVDPTTVSVLGTADKPATVTLITCDPPGTSIHRLAVTAEQISPDPSGNVTLSAPAGVTAQTKVIPGNSPTLWSRFWSWFSQ